MYVREAKNRDEVWLLDHIEAMGLDETAFRSRDYVIAVDEESNQRVGFGRIRVHTGEGEQKQSGRRVGGEGDVCELTSIGVLEEWRSQGVGAHVVERLLDHAGDQGFETVYALTDEPEYLAQFGFERITEEALPPKLRERLAEKREEMAPEAVPMAIAADGFEMPRGLRERFKHATEEAVDEQPEESAEDFGIDPESATYKYDTGG